MTEASRHPGRSDQEAEFVATEPGVQIASLERSTARKSSDRIWSGQDAGDPFDDAVAERMPERVVVPLEAGDIDDTDAAPADALLDREERLDAFHEPVEVQELRLGIAMGLLGEVGDDVLEVAGDVADGDVLFRQLVVELLQLGRESFRERANSVVLRLFDQLPLIRHHLLDGLKKLELPRTAQAEPPPDPRSELRRRTWLARFIGRAVGPPMEVAVLSPGVRHRGVTVENHST
jgi:hypothetical protein